MEPFDKTSKVMSKLLKFTNEFEGTLQVPMKLKLKIRQHHIYPWLQHFLLILFGSNLFDWFIIYLINDLFD